VDGPVHGVVADDHGGNNVEDLRAETAEGVEDGVVGRVREGVLAVGGEAVGDDAALLLAACAGVSAVWSEGIVFTMTAAMGKQISVIAGQQCSASIISAHISCRIVLVRRSSCRGVWSGREYRV
jgi:hypothetical protein